MRQLLSRLGNRSSKKIGKYDDDNGELNLEAGGINQNNKPIQNSKQLESILNEAKEDLKYISIRNRKLQWPFVIIIVEKKYSKLETLCMDGNYLGVKGCKQFSKGSWPNLVNLQLNENQIQNTGLSHLVKAKLTQLQLVSLKKNRIKDEGVPFLLGNPWKKLRIIYFQENQPTIFGSYRFLTTHIPKKHQVYGFERVYMSWKHLQGKLDLIKTLINEAYPGLMFVDFG